MNLTRHLTTGIAILAASFSAAAADAPDILIPDFEGGKVIHGLSNNGKYGVASVNPGADGFSYTVGAVFYDLTGDKPVATDLSQRRSAVGANDVTDDGRIVVGSVDSKPAYCVNEGGKWTWHTLPVPVKTFDVEMEDFNTGITSVQKFKLNGGEINAVTPDGKYGVGLARSNEYELLEYAVMWDLTDGTIVEVDSPREGSNGYDEFQSRYIQLSNDGRYILCYNSFSYNGAIVFVYDRVKGESIYIDRVKNPDGTFSPRNPNYWGVDVDGFTKSLTSDGRYVTGGTSSGDDIYIFRFDVTTGEFIVYDDGIHDDATGWSVTPQGLTLGATPAVTPYADAVACHDNFLFPFSEIYKAYGLNMESKYFIDNTGKPFLVSDDGRTIVFVTSQHETYVARFKEDLTDAIARVDLMDSWTPSPRQGTAMTAISTITVAFSYPIDLVPSKVSEVKLLDSKGNVAYSPMASGGVRADGMRLVVTFRPQLLKEGEEYTLLIPEGIANVKGRPANANKEIRVKYTGRADVPVKVTKISPSEGTALESLDLNDNPIQVTFDVPVQINGTAEERPIAHLYITGENEPVASLALDTDLNTGTLIIYPATTFPLYKGAEYEVRVPQGAVCDISGRGPSEAFTIHYTGSFVPQIGDEMYIFRSTCDNFENFIFYEGDKGTPVQEYADMGFTFDTTPWWVVAESEESTDMAFASHSVYTDGRAANDWVATRQLNIPAKGNAYLTFQSQSYKKSKQDRLKVYVYVYDGVLFQLTGSVVENILANGDLVYDELQSPGNSEAYFTGDWRDNTIPLEKYRGKNIYICFLNDNQNQSLVAIDNIEVVKEVKAFVTPTHSTNVVAQQGVQIKGILTVASDLVNYSSLAMTLKDAGGKEVSKFEAKGLDLSAGDVYNFEFPAELPVTLGEETTYTIEYSLDDDEMMYEGFVRNLAFQTEKRIIVEEYTGRDCIYCPLGILAMENLENRFGDKVIPVILHAYQGDPKGMNITDYASAIFGSSPAAPSAIINRGESAYAPMSADSNNKYHYTASELGEGAAPLWQDVAIAELSTPAFLDLDVKAVPSSGAHVKYDVNIKSAINLTGQNIRVLGVLLEDGIIDSQRNALYTFDDPALGEFGKGGTLSNATVYYVFNNVARGYWGNSVNGNPRLLPSEFKVNEEYPVSIDYAVPAIVDKVEKLKMAVILIDGNTGRVVNAAVCRSITGVEEIMADEAAGAPVISVAPGEVTVKADGNVTVDVFTADGQLLRSAAGYGLVSLGLDGYRGLVIVRAASAGNAAVKKVML